MSAHLGRMLTSKGIKGEAGRFQYERARAQWFSQFMLNVPGAPKELPTFDELAAHAIQRAQIAARAPLWDKAFRAYKERFLRERDLHEHSAAERGRCLRAQQELWVEEVAAATQTGWQPDVPLCWPACNWQADAPRITMLMQFMLSLPPTGDSTWTRKVEQHAAEIFLQGDGYWDDVEAAGYRMLISLPFTPRELRDLPLNDRLWVHSINHSLGFHNQVAEMGLNGGANRAYQLAFAQFQAQRPHPFGLEDIGDFMCQVGLSWEVPLLWDGWTEFLSSNSELLLAPWHPNCARAMRKREPLQSVERPRTRYVDLYELDSLERKKVQIRVNQETAKHDVPNTFMRGIIPFGDLHKAAHASGIAVTRESSHELDALNGIIKKVMNTSRACIATAPAPASMPSATMEGESESFAPLGPAWYALQGCNMEPIVGKEVRIHSLRTRPDLTGARGVILHPTSHTTRNWRVPVRIFLGSNAPPIEMSLKADNLDLVHTSSSFPRGDKTMLNDACRQLRSRFNFSEVLSSDDEFDVW